MILTRGNVQEAQFRCYYPENQAAFHIMAFDANNVKMRMDQTLR
jgi:hypothetical protein